MTPMSLRTPILLALLVCLSGQASPLFAQTPRDVHVLGHGPLRVAEAYRLVADGSVLRLPSVPLVPDLASEPVEVSDLKVLPDGQLLMAKHLSKGVVTYAPGAMAPKALWDPQGLDLLVSTASVAAYTPVGSIARLVFAETRTSQIFLYDVLTDRLLYSTTLLLPGGKAEPVQAIVMPGDRVVVASNWPREGLSGIDIVTFGPQGTLRTRLATRAHDGGPQSQIVVPELEEVRDLQGLGADTMVVATAKAVLALGVGGEVAWRLEVAQDPKLTGSVSSVALLGSGEMAVTTLEPGFWTEPHPNHRVHWYTLPAGPGEAPLWLGSSPPLERAPRRVTSAMGTGGTGTLGYTAGLMDVAGGELSSVESSGVLGLMPGSIRQGGEVTLTQTLRNTGEVLVYLSAARWLATQGSGCMPGAVPPVVLLEQRGLSLEPGMQQEVSQPLRPALPPGSWCVYLELEGPRGEKEARFAQGALLEVEADSGRATVQVPKRDLELQVGDFGSPNEMGQDMGQGGSGAASGGGGEGCGCGQTGSQTPGGWPLEVLGCLGALWALRRQRIW